MPMPQEYQLAHIVYNQILTGLCEELHLATRNQTYSLLQSVLLTFRRRLTAPQVLQFASLLPPIVRAIFVKDWNEREYQPAFGGANELIADVKDLRRAHKFADDHAIRAVSHILRRYMDKAKLDAALADISDEAIAFWHGNKANLYT